MLPVHPSISDIATTECDFHGVTDEDYVSDASSISEMDGDLSQSVEDIEADDQTKELEGANQRTMDHFVNISSIDAEHRFEAQTAAENFFYNHT